jgi:hypothetical protein
MSDNVAGYFFDSYDPLHTMDYLVFQVAVGFICLSDHLITGCTVSGT